MPYCSYLILKIILDLIDKRVALVIIIEIRYIII